MVIGILKGKTKVYCEVCKNSHLRLNKVNIYENTQKELDKAKEEMAKKLKKSYTCRICKIILKEEGLSLENFKNR